MKIFLQAFIFIAVSISALVIAAQAQSKAVSVAGAKTVHLKQTHYFLGDLDIKASMTGVRLVSTGSWKFILVSKAPDWKVTVYRTDDKIYFTDSFKQFSEQGLVSQLLIGKKTVLAPGVGKPTHMKVGNVTVMRAAGPYTLCEYVPSEKLVANQVQVILYNTLRMPTGGGISLLWSQKKEGRDWMTGLHDDLNHTMLSTKFVEMENAPAYIFEVPKGYKLAKSSREVLISQESRESSGDAKDLFELHK